MQMMFLTEPTPLETRTIAMLSLLKHKLYLECSEVETVTKSSLATLHSMVRYESSEAIAIRVNVFAGTLPLRYVRLSARRGNAASW
jgi:hypothetical protein